MDLSPSDELKLVLSKYGAEVIADMARVLKDTENLKKDISYRVVEKDGDYTLAFEIPGYGIFVDEGRRAGAKMPPVDVIEKWAKKKGLPQFRDDRGRFTTNKSRAFLIARAIGRDGIKPRPFINLIYKNLNQLVDDIGNAAANDLAVALQTTFDESGLNKS